MLYEETLLKKSDFVMNGIFPDAPPALWKLRKQRMVVFG